MTEDEINANLVSQFALWKAQIYRLIKASAIAVVHAYNSNKVNGKDTADLIAIIDAEVLAHENTVNAHGDTLAQLGGITKATYDADAVPYFPKDGLPITEVPLLAPPVSGTQMTIPSFSMHYQGRAITVPGTVLYLAATPRQYIKVTITGTYPNYVATMSNTTDVSENISTIIIGAVNYANSAFSAAFQKVVRIGYAVLTPSARGLGIPVSLGTQASTGATSNNWYAG
jgi:hypothetical protein